METLLTFLSLFLSTHHVFLSLTAFKFFSLFLFLSNLIMLCLGAVVFIFYVFDVYEFLRSASLLFSSNVEKKLPLCLHMVLVLSFFPRRTSITAQFLMLFQIFLIVYPFCVSFWIDFLALSSSSLIFCNIYSTNI